MNARRVATDFFAEANRLAKLEQLALMRSSALRFRELVAIGGYTEPNGVLHHAWSELNYAKAYRDMARQLGKWASRRERAA